MKMNKNALILLLTASMLLAACGGTEPTVETTAPVDSAETTPAETELVPDIPDVTFEGEELRIMYRYGAHAYNIEDIWVEDQNGEIINDTVFARNRAVEEKFGLTIVPMPEVSPVAQLRTGVMAGDDFCEILADRKYELFPAIIEDYTWNLYDLTYIDFTKPWWDANAVEQMAVGDKSSIMVGDYNLSSTCGATFIWFNKQLLDNFGFDMPYDAVRDGTWTIDRMLEMINASAADLNGDQKMGNGDRFGFLSQVPYRMTTGFGVQLTERDESNIPVLAPMSDRLVEAMDIVTALMNDKEHTISYSEMSAGQDTSAYPHIYAYGRSKFAAGQILFVEASISFANELREMKEPYGIVPMPKLDEKQERNYNLVDEYAAGWVIPASSTKTEMTDVVMEYMAYASAPLVDAVYETTLKGKRMDSPDDAEMLDLIRATTWYEITFVLETGIRPMLEAAVQSGNLASEYAASAPSISAKMEALRSE